MAAASRGECDVAPVHLIDPATGNTMCIWRRPASTLVPGWQRMQGILFRPGDQRFEGKDAQQALQAALADTTALMVNRNAGSGTRVLIDRLLAGARPPGYANQPKSHNAVAAAIAQERADWGAGHRAGGAALRSRLHAGGAGTLRFSAGRETAGAPGGAGVSRRAARRGVRARIRALGMQPADG